MREKVQSILDETDNIVIKDPTSIQWESFPWTNGYYKHYISKTEIERPYMISYTYYGSVEYWDIILILNNIEDIFEVVPYSELYLPKLVDIKQFILDNRK